MKRVAILLSGTGSNMVKLVESMSADHPARPCLVLSNDPKAGGLTAARARGVAVASLDHRTFKGDREAFEKELLSVIEPYQPDIICLAGFMRILTPLFIGAYAGRMLNIHPSLLPKYRGLHTHARALDAGDAEAGCTVHEVTAELDDGPILGQARVPVMPSDSPETLAARVLAQEHVLYAAVLRRFAQGDRTPVYLP
ncbi:phosphoribosylglycinamide formyltransferase [Aquicoccus sp. G2-2]|uniref:phosphoribosylglycinamide formyltransferase n=1 Tax=Aquicoccus sp. G2-2 TaxID=3092120 RepID=UPI002AE01BAD|nr:phosphoribosylglycinamide formyltransferase [Aquicoccus sp. G2-2]MEA1113367.1 phosphoribosylglycinamide formyltransferase [Aquicoccus sp. G2-2]